MASSKTCPGGRVLLLLYDHDSYLFVVMYLCVLYVPTFCDWWCWFGVGRAVFLRDRTVLGAAVS